MTMTLSPSSTWGVKVGLCLPRRRIATIEASRPTMSPSASIITHFFSTSAGFAEKVFISNHPFGSGSRRAGAARGYVPAAHAPVNRFEVYVQSQDVRMEVFLYL